MKKEIRFSSLIDTKEFDAAIDRMQKKLQDMYRQTESSRNQFENKQRASSLGLGPAPTAGDRVRLDQEERRSRTEMDRFIKTQIRDGEVISRELAKQLQMRRELLKISQQDADAKKRLADVEKQIATNREKQTLNERIVRQALDQRMAMGGQASIQDVMARAANAYAGAGLGGAGLFGRMGAGATAMGRGLMGSPGAALGLAGGVLGAFGSAAVLGSNVYNQFNTAERETLSLRSQAAQGLSTPAMNALGRGAMEEVFFAQERADALKKATAEIRRQKTSDIVGLGGRLALSGAAIAGGAATGAAVGSVVPGIGTLIGGVAGGAAAGFAALRGTGASQDIIDRLRGTREAGYQQQIAARAEEIFQSSRNIDPLRQAAFQRTMQESMANLPIQRAIGMRDQDMRDLLIGGTERGFTTDITRATAGNILQAGGSARAAGSGLVTRANVLERNLGLTNASNVIGRLSGLTGEAGATDAAVTKILAEAFSLGLDDSQFRTEQRKFVDIASSLISSTGAVSAEGQQALVRGLGDFVTDRTMAGMEAARTAMQVVSETTATTGGARGAIQASIINRDPRFKDLNIDERNALLSLSEDQIRAGGPLVEGILSKTGMDRNELIDTVKRPALSTRADIDRKIDMLKNSQEGSEEYRALSSEVISGLAYDNPNLLRLRPLEQRSLLRSLTAEGVTEEERRREIEVATAKVSAAEMGGPEFAGDRITASQAASDRAMLDVMETFRPSFDSAAEGARELAASATEAAKTIRDAYKTENFDPAKVQSAIDNLVRILNVAAPNSQSGAALVQEKGAPSGGR